MTDKLQGVQASVLKWARETQGYSIEEIAERMKRSPLDILDWESGVSTPTYVQLEALAYTHYKRPLAVFFLPTPPMEPEIKKEFRTLPDAELEALASDTRYQLRLGQSFQLSLKELNDGVNPCKRQVFRDFKLSIRDDIEAKALAIREYLDLTMQEQSAWGRPELALKIFRRKIEGVGVFVFKRAFKQKDISGFCLKDDEFPIIYINNSTTKTRQIFTLFHELAHLLLRINAISKIDFSYIDALRPAERKIEQFCNAFAAEVLMPSHDFDQALDRASGIEDAVVAALATRYCVSREAVFRRMLDRKLISQAEYLRKAKEWASQKEKRESGSGGDYYLTQGAYLGESYLRLVFGKHYAGKLTLGQVAEHLGVRTGSVAGLDILAMGKGDTG